MRLGILTGIAATLGLMAGTASATVYDLTFTGSVGSGTFDTLGLFGVAGGDLSGDAVTMRYVLDDTKAVVSYGVFGSETVSDSGTQDFITSATTSINGHTISLSSPGTESGVINYSGLFSYFMISQQAQQGPYSSSQSSTASGNVFIGSPFSVFSSAAGNAAAGTGWSNEYSDAGGSEGLSGGLATISESLAVGVPEPSTWAMMLIGFGVLGVAMRRRRKGLLAL